MIHMTIEHVLGVMMAKAFSLRAGLKVLQEGQGGDDKET